MKIDDHAVIPIIFTVIALIGLTIGGMIFLIYLQNALGDIDLSVLGGVCSPVMLIIGLVLVLAIIVVLKLKRGG